MNHEDIKDWMKATALAIFTLILFLLTSCVGGAGDPLSNRATADALIRQAEYQEDALTATAQAPIVQITETAAAMFVEQQYWTATAQSIQQTQMSSFTQTAFSWTPTPNATSTAMFMALNAQATQTQLGLERQQIKNQFEAILPGVTVVTVLLAFILVLMWASRLMRFRPATVGADGRIVPILDIVEGTFTDIERSPNYRGETFDDWINRWLMERLNMKPQLQPVTPERQDSTTQRAQLTDLATRTANNSSIRRAVANEMEKHLSTSNLESRFKVLGPGDAPSGIIDDEIMNVLDAEWKEVQE